LRNAQSDGESFGAVFELDHSPVRFGNLIDNRQPEPHPLAASRGISAGERAHQVRHFCGGDARSTIAHIDREVTVPDPGTQMDRGFAVPQGIGQKVIQRTEQGHLLSLDHNI
jgi:hypothetical protein